MTGTVNKVMCVIARAHFFGTASFMAKGVTLRFSACSLRLSALKLLNAENHRDFRREPQRLYLVLKEISFKFLIIGHLQNVVISKIA